ncbi:MAG: ACP S-malonyltransferase [Micavibrio aeruginosavorus]|uniref:Malonyl CoA-acyl carrier protein transacylase n=1 Tax=Micavibrio aeruginosavorus TaxID=349221 RepID=A0A7T5UGS7_9BACT|nr:MAG: ACP S-malonyltransferase [Micavibrio aeruginosavorus]
MTRAFIFPGQGSQSIGMGKDLADTYKTARETFEEINDALGQNLTRIMWEGSEGDINLTENTQPALMAVSMAVMNVLTKDAGVVLPNVAGFVAGHSLGEYSALTAAGAFTLPDTARLLKLRGQSMQQAVPVGQGAMAAILGLEFDQVKAIALEASVSEICEAANDNAPGQVVISGHKGAVEAAMALATAAGAKRALALPVSAPFHCRLMAPAADKMREALGKTDIRPPVVPVVANVTASAVSAPDQIRNLLVDQITGRVRWRESVTWMKEQGVTEMIEIGSGKVLAGLVKRIEGDVAVSSVGTPAQIDELVAKLK